MAYEQIETELDNGVMVIRLNRPERRNATTFRMGDELRHAFKVADDDDDVRVIILTGAGDFFCAGVDIGGADGMDPNSDRYVPFKGRSRDPGGLLTMQMFESKKLIICAINGTAVGFGVGVTLPADIRIAVEGSRFAIPMVRRGFCPESCHSWFLPRIVGISRAVEWAASGRFFSVEEAKEAGLVREIVPRERLMERAMEIARDIADNAAPVAVGVVRAMMWQLLDKPIQECHRLDTQMLVAMARTPDTREGFAAFLEKRKPSFPLKPSTQMPAFYPWWKPRDEEWGEEPLDNPPTAFWP